VRVPPTMPMQDARRAFDELVRDVRRRHPDWGIDSDVYLTAPGAEIEDDHPLVEAIDRGHSTVFGAPPERDAVRWFSDASALTRYGVATVNYGTSSGLPGPEGENLDVEGLVRIAKVYALVAADVCGVAE
jgi:acetylornithine deacetylase/succinyl-diaminopimelate desuccinylase-like protein